MTMLVVALLHSRLDYGNSVLVCIPAYLPHAPTPVGDERGDTADLPLEALRSHH